MLFVLVKKWFKRTFIWTYEFRQMAISCKWLHISKLIIHQLRILYKLRCCWSIHCMKHLWMNWFIVVPRKQYWVMVQKILYLNAYWIRWNFNNACNASCYYCTFFCIARAWCVFIIIGKNILFFLGSQIDRELWTNIWYNFFLISGNDKTFQITSFIWASTINPLDINHEMRIIC